MLVCALFAQIGTRDRGYSAYPVFPAPSMFGGTMFMQSFGQIMPREGKAMSKPSLRGAKRRLVRRSSASEGGSNPSLRLRGAMDCFAEPVIGRAFARPVGSQ